VVPGTAAESDLSKTDSLTGYPCGLGKILVEMEVYDSVGIISSDRSALRRSAMLSFNCPRMLSMFSAIVFIYLVILDTKNDPKT